jgi:hypothetical protein
MRQGFTSFRQISLPQFEQGAKPFDLAREGQAREPFGSQLLAEFEGPDENREVRSRDGWLDALGLSWIGHGTRSFRVPRDGNFTAAWAGSG